MDEGSGVTARPQRPPSAAPSEASNPSAITSLVFGILAFVIQLVAWKDLVLRWLEEVIKGHPVLGDPALGIAGLSIGAVVSLAVGISAIVFGVKGRRLAKAGAPGRITATIGLVLGIVCVSIPILALLAFIAWVGCCLENI
jgi:hypothetical protein